MSAANVEDARAELANLLLERADRFRLYLVAFAVVQALLATLAFVLRVVPTACWIGAASWTLLALLLGGRVIRVSGQITRYQQDRIVYLQALVAAHDVRADPERSLERFHPVRDRGYPRSIA
jgi:hypothetical protein